MRTSFAARIRQLVIALCLGFGLATLGAFHLLGKHHLAEATNRDVHTVSGMLAALIQGRGDLLESVTRFAATSPRVRGLSATDAQTVRDAIGSLRADMGVDALSLTDRDGRLLGEDGFRETTVLQLGSPAVATALQGNDWSGILERDGDLMVAASEPLRIGDMIHGVIVAYIRLGQERAREIKGRTSVEIAFVDGGKVTSSSIPIDRQAPIVPAQPWTTTLGGRDFVAQYAPLPGSKLGDGRGFIVLRPVDDVLSDYQKFSLTFLGVLVLVASVALASGSFFATSMVRSLDGVVQAAQRLQKGEWPEKLPVSRKDEIGLLEKVFNEMTDSMRHSQERLLSIIDVDPLTELDNHRRFKERLEQEAARTTAADETLALLVLDVDRFGDYNESQGHLAGDQKLQEVAHALRAEAPEFAGLARYAGEEFAVLLPSGSVEDAEALYQRLRLRVQGVTLSGGCADLASAKGRTEGLIVAAEIALARAKQLGRDQVCAFGSVPGSDEDEPTRLYRNLQDGTYATIRALAAAVDAKDPYTHGHSDRVAHLAADLAAYMGADEQEVDAVHRCGTLHDVGKIGVPDAILQKPSRLDPDEFRVMQTHPVLGEFIASKVPQLRDLLPGVRHHHERYDGKGYPDGLRGEEIPRIARFLAVADTYDAMTSDRPYRKGLEPETALAEIEKNAGVQFDPEMARAFVEMLRAKVVCSEGRAAVGTSN